MIDGKIPRDHELWKQCHECGTIVPVYEAKKESRLVDFVETSDNPFDEEHASSVFVEESGVILAEMFSA